MQEQKQEKVQAKKKSSKKKKRKYNLLYFYLFAIVFILALSGFSYVVKSYSPDIDVAIGNNDALTLSESEMDVEIKSVDERLKWIQMEDEMPTVALRDSQQLENPLNVDFLSTQQTENIEPQLRKQEENKKTVVPPPTPTMKDIQTIRPDFRAAASDVQKQVTSSNGVIPLPTRSQSAVAPSQKVTISKVYISGFSSLEEAMTIQKDISYRDSSISPFVKVVNGAYIVQIGSFSDKDKAIALQQKIQSMGYSPKIMTSN